MASRGEAREQKTTKIPEAIPNFDPSRRATPTRRFLGSAISRGRKTAFHMLQHISLARRANFTARPRSLWLYIIAQALPCLVPGCLLVAFQIAASGIENALLAMTKSVGFAGKRNDFRNETFDTRCRAIPRKNCPHIAQNIRFQTKTPRFCVIARSAATWQS